MYPTVHAVHPLARRAHAPHLERFLNRLSFRRFRRLCLFILVLRFFLTWWGGMRLEGGGERGGERGGEVRVEFISAYVSSSPTRVRAALPRRSVLPAPPVRSAPTNDHAPP